MSVIVIGSSHRTADVALLDRLAVPSDEVPKALRSLLSLEHVLEAVVLSTCNRVELYAHVTRFHPGVQEVSSWLAERGDVHPQDLEALRYSYHDESAAAHLFAVASGLDSMVVGERQIAVQVKQAMETARHEGATGRMLQRLFRQAVRTGRRVRRDTDVSRGASSMVDVGLEAVQERVGGTLDGRRVLIVGAGKMGALTAERLRPLDLDHVRVWNRSQDKALRLAARLDGEVVPEGGLVDALAGSDVVVCTTGAPEPVIDADLMDAALARREAGAATQTARGADDASPLALLDLAVPRNVDPSCGQLPGVAVVDIDDVRALADAGPTGEVVAQARALVEEEAQRFLAWTRAAHLEPTIRAMREHAERIRAAELDRLSSGLSDLDERQRETVEQLTRGILNTLLHDPTVRLKALADHERAELHADALRELFQLVVDDESDLTEDL